MTSAPDPHTLAEAFARYADANISGQALEFWDADGQVICYTHEQVIAAIHTSATILSRGGVVHGGRVLVAMERGDLFFFVFWACQLLGAAVVPAQYPNRTRSHRQPFESLERIAVACRATAAVFDRRDEGQSRLDIICLILGPEELMSPQLDYPPAAPNPADLAVIQFTSGSTSEPKGCMLTHSAVVANALGIIDRAKGRAGDTNVHWVPLHHDMGLMGGVISPVVGCGCTVIIETRRFMFHPLCWIHALADRGRVHTSVSNFAISMVLRRMKRLRLEPESLSQVCNIICGAELIDGELMQQFLAAGAEFGLEPSSLHAGYGLAEVTVMATSRPGGLRLRTLAHGKPVGEGDEVERSRMFVSVGTPVRGATMRILDADGRECPAGEIGEVALRSPSAMSGYFENPSATAERLRDGWLMTGDLGAIFDGELFITGRASDMMVIAGQNFFPQDIEPTVADALDVDAHRVCAFSVCGASATEELVVVVEWRFGDVDPAVLGNARAQCLSHCGVAPATWVVMADGAIPRTSSGKPRRLHLRDRFLAGEFASFEHRVETNFATSLN